MKNKKIWLLIDSSKAGGIETHVYQLAEGLHKHDEDILVIFLNHYGVHPMRELLNKQGIPNITLDGRLLSLWKMLRRARPSILHTHGYKAGIIGRLSAWLCRVPSVTTYHAGEIASGKLAIYDWIDRATAIFADHVFAVSPQIAKRLPVASQITNNFINTSNLTNSTGNKIAFVGRVSNEKGPDYFILLAKQFPEHNFHLYGDGPQLKDLINTSPGNLHFHGQQDDMSVIWPQIGLLVMPSRHEGLPMAALEAMSRGIPVLAYRVGALDRLIIQNTNGWLVNPGDIEQLTERLNFWLNATDMVKQRLRMAARKTIVDKFSTKRAIPMLIDRYREISN